MLKAFMSKKKQTKKLESVYCQGSVCEILEHEKLTNQELLELDVDILIPAATENVIDNSNMEKIKAPIIVEVANGPITNEAINYLHKKNIQILPDVLVNSGGVIVSYFEWVQNKASYYWSEAKVNKMLEERLHGIFMSIM